MSDYDTARSKRDQELFNITWRGLSAQGFVRSRDASIDLCMYRGPGGHKCAFGHHIPDGVYHPIMERSIATSLRDNIQWRADDVDWLVSSECTAPAPGQLNAMLEWLWQYSDEDMNVLREHQRIHDEGTEPDSMRARLLTYAARNNLTIPQDM
jgi:hypothetical protein